MPTPTRYKVGHGQKNQGEQSENRSKNKRHTGSLHAHAVSNLEIKRPGTGLAAEADAFLADA
jgi:hypothetical protein